VAQVIRSRVICDGRFCVRAVEDIGHHKPRVIEIELDHTGEQVQGSARWLDNIVRELQTIHAVASAEALLSASD